ncbi:response regulator [Ruminococcaceae bacterium OttesenSCG-928-I18]|nr:response regulator [Ruminococcaceae bacterium OttesenSCG-928-I18]
MSTNRKKMLVVDDVDINRAILNELFSEQFEVLEAENGEVALALIEEHEKDLAMVLLDLMMPVKDGFEVLEEMNNNGLIQQIPVILITGENDDEKSLLGYGLGVSDLVYKPFNPDIICRRVNNVVDLYSYKNFLEQKLDEQRKELERQAAKLRESNLFLVDALSTTVEFRNSESGEHIKRIRALVRILLEKLAKDYSLTPEQIEQISSASALHDIGKIAIPDKVLLKPGALTDEEYEIMKTHSMRGCEILDSLNYTQDKEYFGYVYDICRHHHERWDGRGYPDGLKGDEISIWAQATSLADVYDALTSKRVYKDAYTHEEATQMILNGECGEFNPKLLEVFMEVKDTLNEEIQLAHAKERGQPLGGEQTDEAANA